MALSATHDGRYAPSPTGALHLGNLRTALIAWLRARSKGARFLLRIDDLDPDRARVEHEVLQLADLHSLGLDWDGAPIHQRPRRERYETAIRTLQDLELAYPCFCSRADIRAAASAPHDDGPDGAYPGTCAHLAAGAAARRISRGEESSMRVRANGAHREFDDLLMGRVEGRVDDFVIRRKDGVAAYNLATVLDDLDLGVGEVVRGRDLAASTPRQLWLAQVLADDPSKPPPTFAHVPLVRSSVDGARLAKRHGAVTLAELAHRGLRAADVRLLLVDSLGDAIQGAATEPLLKLATAFDLSKLPRGDSHIDATQLRPGVRWAEALVASDDQLS